MLAAQLEQLLWSSRTGHVVEVELLELLSR